MLPMGSVGIRMSRKYTTRPRRLRGPAAADFRLLVDGREVPIEYFAEIDEGRAAATAGAASTAGAPAAAAPVAAGEEVGRSYLVYVDDSFSVAGIRNEALAKLQRDLE